MPLTTSSSLLADLLSEWHLVLQGWSADGRLTAAAQEALLLNGEPDALTSLIHQWAAGEFGALPPVVLLSSADINGAMGAYAISTSTIYLNAGWLAGASKEQGLAVLTEELGHHLDHLLNRVDTPGDEGDYFAKLLAGGLLMPAQLAAPKAEQDQGQLHAAGQLLAVEQAVLPQVSITATANGNEADGSPVVFSFRRTGDTAATLSIGYRLFGTAQAGSDYSGSTIGNISFLAGSATATLSLPALADGALIDPGETIIARIAPASSYSITPGQQFATATITAEGMVVTPNRPTRPGWGSGERRIDSSFAALKADGSVVAWGSPGYGGTAPEMLSGVTQIFSTEGAFAALKRDGSIVSWGSNWSNGGNSSEVPTGLSGVTQIFSTNFAFAALKSDSSVVTWGNPDWGGTAPTGLSGVSKIFSNYYAFAALKGDGTVDAWGDPRWGGEAPAGLSGVTKIFSTNSAFAALKADGTVVAWGDQRFGDGAPAGLSGVTQIFSTFDAFAALRSDGSVVTWGGWGGIYGEGTPPEELSGVSQIFSTVTAFAFLKSDGSVVAWGVDGGGTPPEGLSGVSQIFSNHHAFAALKSDGTVVAWGIPNYGGTAPEGLSGVTQIFSTNNAFAALKSDGSVVAWGDTGNGGMAPAGLSGVTQIYSSANAFAALKSDGSVVTWGSYGGSAGTAPEGLSGVVGFANAFTDDRLVTFAPPPSLVTLAVSPASVPENGSTNLVFTFTRTGATTSALPVNYTVGGTARLVASPTDPADYTFVGLSSPATSRTIIFAAGAATATVSIDPTADSDDEPNETVALTLTAGAGYTIATSAAVVGTITNDDVPPPSDPITSWITALAGVDWSKVNSLALLGALPKNATNQFSISLPPSTTLVFTGQNMQIKNIFNPRASSSWGGTVNKVELKQGATIKASAALRPTALSEIAQKILTDLGDSTPGLGRPTVEFLQQRLSVSVPAFAIAPLASNKAEGRSGPTPFTFTVSRLGSSAAAGSVRWTVAGSGSNPTDPADFTGATSGTLSFAAGQTSRILTINAAGDLRQENDESFSVRLSAPNGGILGPTVIAAATIRNDDQIGDQNPNTLSGGNLPDWIDGRGNGTTPATGDTLTGRGAADTFAFRFGESPLTAPDRITDFQIAVDKIDLITANGGALPTPTALNRAANNSTARTLSELAASVFRDANGAVTGNQALGANRAALVVATRAPIAGTYVVINDGSAIRSNSTDLLINITGFSGALPGLGVIPVSSVFA